MMKYVDNIAKFLLLTGYALFALLIMHKVLFSEQYTGLDAFNRVDLIKFVFYTWISCSATALIGFIWVMFSPLKNRETLAFIALSVGPIIYAMYVMTQ